MLWVLQAGGEDRESCKGVGSRARRGVLGQEGVLELTRLVLAEAFLHPEDCGKVLFFLQLGRLGLEFVEPGIAHSGGCQEVWGGWGRRPSWVDADRPRPPSHPAFLEQLGVVRGCWGTELSPRVGLGCRGQGLFLSAAQG